ncbi:hypothetical protein [Rickettsia endosymbiont of Nabis limbatus]|uniref:hypothetical protein n=1 Tax=Rickettsia endosymbiont of Nabis limbatus TaxID=3066268 RepID=UPI003AF38CFF
MEEFLQKFIKNLGVEKIKYLLADREFMNKEWLNFLINNHIKFAIPLKRDNKIRLEKSLKTLSIVKIFNLLGFNSPKVCFVIVIAKVKGTSKLHEKGTREFGVT